MAENLERLKQRIPLLEYLQRHNWKPCRAGSRQEFVGLCPLHQETRPSFYVNAAKNLFYCHGCGRGGDLIRFVQLFLDLPFRQTVALLEQELTPAPVSLLLEKTAAFYQLQLHRHPEAITLSGTARIARSRPDRGTRHRLCSRRKPAASSRRPGAVRSICCCEIGLINQPRPRCLLPARHLPLPPARPDRQPLWPQYRRRVPSPFVAALQGRIVRLGVGQQLLHRDPGRRAVRSGRAVAGRFSQHHLRHRHPVDARSVGSACRSAGPLRLHRFRSG